MLKVLKSGFYTSIQDLGRFHLRDKGVPVSGAMDSKSVHTANSILENDANAPVLEITMTGPTLLFEEHTYIALAGAHMAATHNNAPICNNRVIQVKPGDIISYGKLEKGFRAYLAVKDGFKTKKILGSASQYHPITPSNRITDGDEVAYTSLQTYAPKISEVRIDCFLDHGVLEVHEGPELALLAPSQRKKLLTMEFSVAKENNRMAYQLNETPFEHDIHMLTSATLPGTVQLTPKGKLIILMKDGQTTGGYPRILQLSEDAIATLAQKRSGATISFSLSS